MADNDPVCKPPKKGYRSANLGIGGTMVTLTIDDCHVSLPMDYLTSVSNYFEKAFTGQFLEAKEKFLELDEAVVTKEIFAIFVEWVNGRKLLNGEGKAYDGDEDSKRNTSRHTELVKIYIFSDAYDIPQFRRDVLDTFLTYAAEHPEVPGTQTINTAYDQLPPNSPMLRALVDITAGNWSEHEADVEYDGCGLPPTFLYSVINEFYSRAQDNTPRWLTEHRLCDYHEHDGET
ncbi:hypothetical protein Vi05172_g7705 [Venturia inaequalis]|nr:hypothetical protein Vi05172_g7705 [Venturia inaequalis]